MRQKIIELFEYRKLPLLLQESNHKDKEAFLESLIDLQAKIYDLDALLESRWDVSTEDFEPHWNILSATLINIGVTRENVESYLHNMRVYLKHELALRDGISPDQMELKEYYYYKSCDVQMIRQLIIDSSDSLTANMTLEDWKFFDFVTEVNDDVTDVVEDHDAINGNGAVFILEARGFEEGSKILKDFLDECEQISINKTRNNNSYWLTNIQEWTKTESLMTKKAIDNLKSVILHHDISLEQNRTVRLASEVRC